MALLVSNKVSLVENNPKLSVISAEHSPATSPQVDDNLPVVAENSPVVNELSVVVDTMLAVVDDAVDATSYWSASSAILTQFLEPRIANANNEVELSAMTTIEEDEHSIHNAASPIALPRKVLHQQPARIHQCCSIVRIIFGMDGDTHDSDSLSSVGFITNVTTKRATNGTSQGGVFDSSNSNAAIVKFQRNIHMVVSLFLTALLVCKVSVSACYYFVRLQVIHQFVNKIWGIDDKALAFNNYASSGIFVDVDKALVSTVHLVELVSSLAPFRFTVIVISTSLSTCTDWYSHELVTHMRWNVFDEEDSLHKLVRSNGRVLVGGEPRYGMFLQSRISLSILKTSQLVAVLTILGLTVSKIQDIIASITHDLIKELSSPSSYKILTCPNKSAYNINALLSHESLVFQTSSFLWQVASLYKIQLLLWYTSYAIGGLVVGVILRQMHWGGLVEDNSVRDIMLPWWSKINNGNWRSLFLQPRASHNKFKPVKLNGQVHGTKFCSSDDTAPILLNFTSMLFFAGIYSGTMVSCGLVITWLVDTSGRQCLLMVSAPYVFVWVPKQGVHITAAADHIKGLTVVPLLAKIFLGLKLAFYLSLNSQTLYSMGTHLGFYLFLWLHPPGITARAFLVTAVRYFICFDPGNFKLWCVLCCSTCCA